MAYVPLGFRVLRTIRPILRFGNTIVVTRYDDVREVFLNDAAFRVPYKDKLDIIMGGHPFFLSMDDTPEYRRDTAAMRLVVRPADITERLAGEVERRAEHIVANAKGHLEIVDSLVRRVTFEVLGAYFGIPDPPGEDLRVWATRLFEFQFADPGSDPALRREVDTIAPARGRTSMASSRSAVLPGRSAMTCSANPLPCMPKAFPALATTRSAAP
jgi:cytochrome P450